MAHRDCRIIFLFKCRSNASVSGVLVGALLCLASPGCSSFARVRLKLTNAATVSKSPSGWTPLHQAALKGDTSAVATLLRQKIEIDSLAAADPSDEFWRKQDHKVTPLAVAIAHGQTAVAKMLVDTGASLPNAGALGDPVRLAAAQGNQPMTQFLLTRGVPIHGVDFYGNTPLHVAKTAAIASLLIQHGARINQINKDGETPLHTAANAEVARFLLAHGAMIDRRDGNGRTPLLVAAADARFDVAKILVSQGADVNAGTDQEHYSALDRAVEGNEADLVHRLLDRGAQVNPRSTTAPLLLAATNGLLDSPDGNGDGISADRGPMTIARLLIERGADLTVRDADGKTPLILAALQGDDLMVALLLRHGARIDAGDQDGYTALHWAALNQFPRVIRILRHYGANIDARDVKGEKPIDRVRNNPQVAGLLAPR